MCSLFSSPRWSAGERARKTFSTANAARLKSLHRIHLYSRRGSLCKFCARFVCAHTTLWKTFFSPGGRAEWKAYRKGDTKRESLRKIAAVEDDIKLAKMDNDLLEIVKLFFFSSLCYIAQRSTRWELKLLVHDDLIHDSWSEMWCNNVRRREKEKRMKMFILSTRCGAIALIWKENLMHSIFT